MAKMQHRDLYSVLETYLRSATTPLSCVDLMRIPEVEQEALREFGGKSRDVQLTTNKLSDVLGFMWRRDVLARYPTSITGSKTRYAYAWKAKPPPEAVPPPVRAKTELFQVIEYDDGVLITFEKFTIHVKPR